MLNFLYFFVLFNAVKTDIKLTPPYGEILYYLIYQDKIKNLEGYIFKKFLTIKKILEWTSGFHAINDLPRAH